MTQRNPHRLLRAETLLGIGLFITAAWFLVPALSMTAMSALLPAAMLVALMLFALIAIVKDQRHASASLPYQRVFKAPGRVSGAFVLVTLHAVCVDLLGFYVSTAIFVPLVAWLFGYRSSRGLAIATVIVLIAVALIFSFAMSQEFPRGRFGLR